MELFEEDVYLLWNVYCVFLIVRILKQNAGWIAGDGELGIQHSNRKKRIATYIATANTRLHVWMKNMSACD